MLMKIVNCVLILTACLTAEWISFDGTTTPTPPSIEIISGDRRGLALKVTIHGMSIRDTTVNGIKYHLPTIPGYAEKSDPGKPRLPVINKMIAIDPSRKPCLFTEIIDSVVLNNYYVYPNQYPLGIKNSANPSFAIDNDIYAQNIAYPHAFASCSSPAIFRDLRVVNLSIFPISFQPTLRALKVITQAVIRVEYADFDSINCLPAWPVTVSDLFHSIYHSDVLNYYTLGIGRYESMHKYLIIADNDFVDALSPFVFWKKKKGLDVAVETVNEPTANQVKHIIEDHCSTPEKRLTYVLLVGDAYWVEDPDAQVPDKYIPTYKGWLLPNWASTPYWTYSDYWYATIAGDDDIPDVALGRFSIQEPEQCDSIINKVFGYERYPNDDYWYIKRHDLVSFKYSDWYEDTFHELTCDSLMPILDQAGFTYYDDYGNWACDYDVQCHINGFDPRRDRLAKGVSLVNYLGHGDVDSWHAWSYAYSGTMCFTNDTIRKLTNFNGIHYARLPIVFEIACQCGRNCQWLSDDGHSECWTRHGGGGAVAALGSPTSTDFPWNGKLNTELYRVPFGDESVSQPPVTQELGWVINEAKIRMAESYGWEEDALMHVRVYHLFGDPEINIYTGWFGNLYCEHPTVTTSTPQNFVVTVNDGQSNPVVDALVCLYQENWLHKIQLSNAEGTACFQIAPRTRNLYVTATKQNYGPYEGICRVLAEEDGIQAQGDAPTYSCRILYDPRRRSVDISCWLPEASVVTARVYDITGKRIRVISDGNRACGDHQITWNCRDDMGKLLSRGVYFVKLNMGEAEHVKKLVIF